MFRRIDLGVWVRLLFVTTLLTVNALPRELCSAAEKVDSETDFPLMVFNVASLQRLRDHADLMFESAERADLTERVDQWTVETLKETKGIDRRRPFGMMTYLNTDEFIRPMGISYIPIENLDEALQTLAYDSGTISPVEGEPDRFDIRYGESFTLRTRYLNEYLFMVGPDGSKSALDLRFPDPAKLTAKLSDRYDIAASVLIKTIPPGMKLLGLEAVKNQAIANLQQRDDEPESVYRLRRANGEAWVDILDKVVNYGEEFTIGGQLDPATKHAVIELDISGTSDSKLAKLFQNMTGKRTYFGNLVANPSTFTMSVSWQMEEKQRKQFVTYFEAAQRDLVKNASSDQADELAKLLDPIFQTLMASAETGHIDAFAQLTGMEQENFVLMAGIKVSTSRNLPSQITQLLEFLQENSNGNEILLKLDPDAERIESLPVHRLPVESPNEESQRLFGESPQLYIYTTPQALWLSFGGELALDALKEAVAQVALPQTSQKGRNRIPFQFVTHAKNWLTAADSENPSGFTERAEASFDSDNDAMTLEFRPTDRGVKLRLELESGFLGLMGRGISNGMENGFFRPPRRGNQEQLPVETAPEPPAVTK
ncbi:hypothetical protein [Schlesneria sp. T3-172]|uniref:hypothetical protein n=1 Tax=Schlesneria sphaerica TaxID=3373610 RepID=UPI0037CB6D97